METEKYEVAIRCRELIDGFLQKVPKADRDEVEEQIQMLIVEAEPG